jgi:hypothetical protein
MINACNSCESIRRIEASDTHQQLCFLGTIVYQAFTWASVVVHFILWGELLRYNTSMIVT